MDAFCRAVVLFTLAALHGCGARTGVVVRSPEFSGSVFPAELTVQLSPVADTVVHNAPDWSSQDLSAEPWVMVGSDGQGLVWETVLSFDLAPVPLGWEPRVATLQLDRLLTPPIPTAAPRMQVEIRLTSNDWSESDVTWDSTVAVGDEMVATCELVEDAALSDSCDLTELVLASLREGRTRLGILLRPADPSIDFRRRWPGATDAPPSEIPSTVDATLVANPASRITLTLSTTAL
ncbi:MAG: hypothetical protein KGO50_19030 [Myxococcales bacterium]|nr:hypothetical protein [Myxococcales bacterium]